VAGVRPAIGAGNTGRRPLRLDDEATRSLLHPCASNNHQQLIERCVTRFPRRGFFLQSVGWRTPGGQKSVLRGLADLLAKRCEIFDHIYNAPSSGGLGVAC
jgi:hypothetical protein